jgi:hypothetical protein
MTGLLALRGALCLQDAAGASAVPAVGERVGAAALVSCVLPEASKALYPVADPGPGNCEKGHYRSDSSS